MGTGKVCVVCNGGLVGRQSRFCGSYCKNRFTNNRFQLYESQQRRGRQRKKRLIHQKGAGCQVCGYNRNAAALEFHHTEPINKLFQLDLRNLSNRRWEMIQAEVEKCILLCSNCHAELHNPESNLSLAQCDKQKGSINTK